MRDFDPTAGEYAGRNWAPRRSKFDVTRPLNDIMSGLAIAAPIIGGLIGSDSASDAADTQAAASDRAAGVQKYIYDDQKATNAPLLANTIGAQNQLMKLLGLDGSGQGINTQFKFNASDLYNDPSYQFRFDQGQKAVERSAAARGMTNSGAQLKALTNYGQGAASQEYGNAYGRAQGTFNGNLNNLLNPLQSLAGGAQTAANSQNQAASNYGNALSGIYTGQGNASAAAQIAGGNALSGGLSGASNAFGQNALLSKLFSGGGSAPSWNSASMTSSIPLNESMGFF